MANDLTRRDVLRYSLGATAGLSQLGLGSFLMEGQPAPSVSEFHISPQGDDKFPGTLEQPFRSLERGKTAVRALLAGSSRPASISVLVHLGRYELHDTFTLDEEDAGGSQCRVTWRAAPGETPVISGGRFISGWAKAKGPIAGAPADAQGKLWVAEFPGELPKNMSCRNLWRNGQLLSRARWPKADAPAARDVDPRYTGEVRYRVVDGYMPAGEDLKDPKVVADWKAQFPSIWKIIELQRDSGLPDNLAENGDAEFVTRNDGSWVTLRVPIAAAKGTKVTLASPLGVITYYWGGMHMMSSILSSGYIENSLALLDSPGEWYLDRRERRVYYMPQDGENPNDHEYVISAIDKLLWIKGAIEKPVSNLHIEGIRFEHADWTLPSFGYRPFQACVYGTQLTPFVADVPVPAGSIRPKDEYPEYCLQPALDLMYAENCTIEDCQVSRVAATAIGLGEGCRENSIIGCEVQQAGGNGIHIGCPHGPICGEDFAWKQVSDTPSGNIVSNCYIHDNGHMDNGALGISNSYAQDTRITNNLVERQPYTGIGGSLTCTAFPTHNDYQVTIQRNIVRDVMQTLDDGGGIYTKDGMAKTSEISGNLVENINGRSIGIYLDDRSYGPHLADNMVTARNPFNLNHTTPPQFAWSTNYIDGRYARSKINANIPYDKNTWDSKNYIVEISDGSFPASLKEKAGPQGPYRRFLQNKS